MNAGLTWRLITDDGVTASFGLAADEYMARRQGAGQTLPVLRLYTYRSHCALVGRFQSVDVEVNRAFCRAHGIAINRRPTGGGAIIMGEDQLGVALTLPRTAVTESRRRLRELLADFSAGIVAGLGELGIEARFARKNDVEVGGRKIAGLGLYRDRAGGLLFHCSLLVDLDIPLMLRVLRTPFEKLADKAIASVAERVTTVRRELGRPVPLNEVRERVRDGFARAFEVELVPDEFTAAELTGIRRLEREKYLSAAWIEQKALTSDLTGSGLAKAPGGLIHVHLTLAGETIKAVLITGDFFVPEGVVAELERRLRWHSAAEEAVARTVSAFFAQSGDAFDGIAPKHVVRAILRAVQAARQQELEVAPRGCFVNP